MISRWLGKPRYVVHSLYIKIVCFYLTNNGNTKVNCCSYRYMYDLHVYVSSVIMHTSSSSPFSSLLPPCSLCFLLLFPLPSQPPTSPYLLHAAMSLLRLLWQGRHDAALVALRSQPDFWKHLTSPLFNELQLSEVEEANIEVCTILPYHFCFL